MLTGFHHVVLYGRDAETAKGWYELTDPDGHSWACTQRA